MKITRIRETDRSRVLDKKEAESKYGKTCSGCKKYFSYLKAQDKFCPSCKHRNARLSFGN